MATVARMPDRRPRGGVHKRSAQSPPGHESVAPDAPEVCWGLLESGLFPHASGHHALMRSTFSSLVRPFASRVAPDKILPWLAVAWSLLLAGNLCRGLRFPHPFAKGHWLFGFRHGFVKRGLPGTLIEPWLR